MRALRVVPAALIAALIVTVAVATADARRFELSNQHIRIIWNPAVGTERLAFGVLESGVECPVTFEGSFHSRTISKVSGQLVGYITKAALTKAECEFDPGVENIIILNGVELLPEGAVSTNTLPWHIRYDSFTGVLPRITGMRLQIIGLSVRLQIPGACLYKSTAAGPAYGILQIEAGGTVTGFKAEETAPTIPRFAGVLCHEAIGWAGIGKVVLLGTTTAIVVRLVL
jgi:hypothetical protein